MKKLLTIVAVFFLAILKVSAVSSCSYKEQTELGEKAANVKFNYEAISETIKFEDMNATKELFNISLLNVTEEFYVVVTNDVTNEEKTYRYSDTNDGVVTFKWNHADKITNFTIKVYSSSKTNCPNEIYKTIYKATPRYNEYYNIEACQEYDEFYLCQKYVDFAPVSEETFLRQIESYRQGKINDDGKEEEPEKTVTDKIFEFLDKYKWYFIGGTVLVVASSVTIYRLKTKKSRELGL